MRRLLIALAAVLSLPALYVLAHWALIEAGNEVIVLRTEEPDGTWHESRLWIVDDAGLAWLHGARRARWMRNLASRPLVEVVRGGKAARYRATQMPGPHLRTHEKLREKYGFADRWVRLTGPDKETTAPVRLERLPPPSPARRRAP
jgi:hypothetical protein